MPGSLTKPIDQAGPLVTVRVGVTLAREQVLRRVGFPVPPPIETQALLDTGSFITIIDANFVHLLKLNSYGFQAVRSAASGLTPKNAKEYDVSVSIINGNNELHTWPQQAVLEAQFEVSDAYHVIIGRDLLDDCMFTYDGKRRTLTLDI